MSDLLEVLGQLFTEPSAVTVEYQRIENLHKLILDQLPYGQIDPASLVQGTIEIDGPAQEPISQKRPLQWHFGGVPYEISKAIRIQYAYQKVLDGAPIYATGSLFIGYETTSPFHEALKAYVIRLATQLGEPLVQTSDDAANLRKKTSAARDQAEAVDKSLAALKLARAKHERAARPTSVEDLLKELEQAFANYPTRVTTLARYVDTANFDTYIDANIPFRTPQEIDTIETAAAAAMAAAGKYASQTAVAAAIGPTPLSTHLMRGPDQLDPKLGVRVEFDGPARQYDSKKPFPYTTDTLFNDPSGLYNQLLWWYFGGRTFRITKAMRIEYHDPTPGNDHHGWLLIGFQGPGPI